ncbi:hypothetical protein J437_LFUL014085 [Ladona fulva]|uniref:Uncharacterized protein n=1 Tax=Ladona fulva TaxID=123851 RepID=A0A8K0KM61_LADFU|nr:hypothetical protein J437_LFUL014085 [Ladona fulva]
MIANDIIEKAPSAYNNPLVIVKKKNNDVRLCIDARKLNSLTEPQRDEPPRVEEILRKFHDWLSRHPATDQSEDKKTSQQFLTAVIDLGITDYPNKILEDLPNLQKTDQNLGKVYKKLLDDPSPVDPDIRNVSSRIPYEKGEKRKSWGREGKGPAREGADRQGASAEAVDEDIE